jgi:outer membrane protein assembly factor BamB
MGALHMSSSLLFLPFFFATVAGLIGAEVRWSTSISAATVETIAIAPDRTVRVAAEDGVVASFSENGERLWRVKVGESIGGIAVGDDGVTYASGEHLVALTSSGQEKWRVPVGEHLGGFVPPVWSGGALYLNAAGALQVKLSREGEVLWKVERIGDHGPWDSLPPFITEKQELIVASDATLHKLNASGQGVWSYPLGLTIRRLPMLIRDRQLWLATAGSLMRLDLDSGSLIWEEEGGYRFGPVALDGENMVLGLNNGNVRCVNNAGKKVWESTHIKPGAACPPVTDHNGNTYATSGSSLHCLDRNGKEKWKLQIPHGPHVAVMSGETRLYVGGIRGMFTAIDVKDD